MEVEGETRSRIKSCASSRGIASCRRTDRGKSSAGTAGGWHVWQAVHKWSHGAVVDLREVDFDHPPHETKKTVELKPLTSLQDVCFNIL